jgi:hypothetical protein
MVAILKYRRHFEYFAAILAGKNYGVKDRRVKVRRLALAHGVSKNTIHYTLHQDLNLSKKSARWVPKLLTDKMKERG